MAKTLSELLKHLPWPVTAPALDLPITGITADSRQVQPGFMFVAYGGVALDGHKYIPQAIAKGAVAVVGERDWSLEIGDSLSLQSPIPNPPVSSPQSLIVPNGREAFAWLCAAWQDFPSRSMTLIGVTGTDGKTSTANLLYSILRAAGHKTGMISTVNAVIGERTLDTGLHVTTPDADAVQSYLAQMRDAGTTHCVLEVTSHGLAQHRVDGCDFDVAVVTNITHEHLDVHGTRETYRAAKGRLFEMASQRAILNADDDYSFAYLKSVARAPVLTYAQQGQADVCATDVRYLPDSMTFAAHTPIGDIDIRTSLIGDFNVANILAAISVAVALDVPGAAIQRGIADLKGVPGRMERIDAGQPYLAVVDFAHTPNSLENCLRTLRNTLPKQADVSTQKLIVVFGCAGERDVAKRPRMGRIAAEQADIVVITAEDPRRESLEAIMDQVEAGTREANSAALILRVADRAEALRHACRLAQPGDIVVACGKGHEQSMCFGTEERRWDDRVAMREAIGWGV